MKVAIVSLFTIFFLYFPYGISAENQESQSKFDFNGVLVHHLMDTPVLEWNIGGKKVYSGEADFDRHVDFVKSYTFHDEKGEYRWDGGIPMHITKRVVMMFIVAILLISVMVYAANKIKSNPYSVNGRFAGIIESMVQFVREEIVNKNIHHGEAFHPFFLSLFFFLLFSNLLGLVPSLGGIVQTAHDVAVGHSAGGHGTAFYESFWPGITVTGDLAVTATFSIMITLLIWIIGFQKQGLGFLTSCIPTGMSPVVATLLYPILFPLELIVGPLAKGFALSIRLLANMTAGHVMILALLGFIFQFRSIWIAPASIISSGMVYMLELFVAFLQAFIFTLLAAIFIGSSMHKH